MIRNNDILNIIRFAIANYCADEFETPIEDTKRHFDECIKKGELIGLAYTTDENGDDIQTSLDINNSTLVCEYYDGENESYKENIIEIELADIEQYLDFDYLISLRG